MTLMIQPTPSHTYLVIETDSDGETFAYGEFADILQAEDCLNRWVEFDEAWDDIDSDYIG